MLGRILTNLHPDILAQVAFLKMPGSYIEVRDVVGLIEERLAVLTERRRLDKRSSVSQVLEKSTLIINRVECLLTANSPVRMDLRVGVVENKDMFGEIVRDVIPQVQ